MEVFQRGIKTEKYINSITFNNSKMALTETVPTKFPEQEVKMMDKLIQRGLYISRSDLIREATREKIKENKELRSDFDLMVKEMKEKGDFGSLEGKVIARLFLEQGKELSANNFNIAEQKVIRKLIRHPFGILKAKKGKLLLTENGQKTARGYLKGLAYARTLF